MKFNKVIALFLVATLVFSACGKETETTESNASEAETEATESNAKEVEENTTEETEDMSELESLGDVDVDSGLFNVKLTIPADYVGESTQEELTATAEEEGYKSIKLNEDGSATYTMTKAQHKEMLDEMKQGMNESIDEMIQSEEFPNVVNIESNEDYTEFKVTTTNEEPDMSESFLTLSFYMYGGVYGIFSGEQADNIKVAFINKASGEVISEENSKDMGE